MKRPHLFPWLIPALAAVALAAVAAPDAVLADLEFFSDFDLVADLDLLEDREFGAGVPAVAVSTASPSAVKVSTAPAGVMPSTSTVNSSTSSWRNNEKK